MTILLASDFGAEERQAWQAALAQCLPGERLVLERAARTAAGIGVAFVANPPPGILAGLPGLKLVQSP